MICDVSFFFFFKKEGKSSRLLFLNETFSAILPRPVKAHTRAIPHHTKQRAEIFDELSKWNIIQSKRHKEIMSKKGKLCRWARDRERVCAKRMAHISMHIHKRVNENTHRPFWYNELHSTVVFLLLLVSVFFCLHEEKFFIKNARVFIASIELWTTLSSQCILPLSVRFLLLLLFASLCKICKIHIFPVHLPPIHLLMLMACVCVRAYALYTKATIKNVLCTMTFIASSHLYIYKCIYST